MVKKDKDTIITIYQKKIEYVFKFNINCNHLKFCFTINDTIVYKSNNLFKIILEVYRINEDFVAIYEKDVLVDH